MTLKLLSTIDLPHHIHLGGFDHAAVHSRLSRLYVAHTANNSVDVVDTSQDQYLYSIPNLSGVAGVLIDENQNLGFTSNRGEDTIGIFSVEDEESMFKIPVGIRPNGLAYDAGRHLLLAANVGDPDIPGSYTISLINVQERSLVASLPVPGRTRWTLYDSQSDVFYVNIANPACIVVINPQRSPKVSGELAIPIAGPHGLDLDLRQQRLFCACDGKHLVVLDLPNGEIINSFKITGTPDVIFYNSSLHHLYIAIGDPGVIDIFDTEDLQLIATVPTEMGAHTLAFDRFQNKVYAFLPHSHRAEVFVDIADD